MFAAKCIPSSLTASAFTGAQKDRAFSTTSAIAPSRLKHSVVLASAKSSDATRVELPDRRTAILASVGAAFVATRPESAFAAYGDGARVFAKQSNTGETTAYEGNGFKLLIPSKWNPNKSVTEGSVLRYADNARDDGGNLDVIATPTSKSSMQEYGSLADNIKNISYLLGQDVFDSATDSEGGFASGKVANAALLDSDVKTVQGKTYYTYHILTRTADGEGGGRHHLIVSTVSGGKLWVGQFQALDKQWFKGSEKTLRDCFDSFVVA